MPLASDALAHQIRLAGNIFRMRYYTETTGSIWDDDRTLTASGNDFYTSGIILAIDATRGSDDQVLIEQGRIRYDDSKIYISGTIPTTSGVRVFTIAISGVDRVYQQIIPGNIVPQYFGLDVYQKLYVRILDNGSLF